MNQDTRNYWPEVFPEAWASEWGEDNQGLWMAFVYQGVRHGFRWIQPGTFMMGSPEDEPEREHFGEDETQHQVILTEGYWLGETTVNQALWEVVMEENLSKFKGPERPVENVSWEYAQQFLKKFNSKRDDLGFRLPTEAEWEYACRAGTTTPFWFGENITPEQVNYNGDYPYANGEKGRNREDTVEVKALPSNSWGLYQMHGNVWEWCEDWFGEYSKGLVTDPKGPETGDGRVLRGGSWNYGGGLCRSAARGWIRPDLRRNYAGFRLARGRTVKQG